MAPMTSLLVACSFVTVNSGARALCRPEIL